jgi:hypothetical protein
MMTYATDHVGEPGHPLDPPLPQLFGTTEQQKRQQQHTAYIFNGIFKNIRSFMLGLIALSNDNVIYRPELNQVYHSDRTEASSKRS